MLEATNESDVHHFDLIGILQDDTKVTASFDYLEHTISIWDLEGNLLLVDTLALRSKAFSTVDPMAGRYPHLSPYSYCAGDPISFIDPSGMLIEEGSLNEWNKLRSQVEKKRNGLQEKINKIEGSAKRKGWSNEKLNKKLGDLPERLYRLNSSLKLMTELENSDQVYQLAHVRQSEIGGLTIDSNSTIIINFLGTENFIHELTHAGQFESGELAFILQNRSTFFQDVYDEVNAYKAQFAYDPISIKIIPSISVAKSFNAITAEWVQGISYMGVKIYGEKGYSNTGILPVNINSTIEQLRNAYPWETGAFIGIPLDYNVRSLPGLYFKR